MSTSSSSVSRAEFYALQSTMFVLLAVAPTAATSTTPWFRTGFEGLMVAGTLWYAAKLFILKRRAREDVA